jgi:hypothetical protein
MKVANIVSTQKVSVSEEFNVVTSMSDIIHGLPTLLIGFDYVNKHYPTFDITNIQLEPDLYWTFKRTEKRDNHEEDLRWFVYKVYADLTNKLNYIFVDPIQYPTKTLWKIVRKIATIKDKVAYVHGKMVYIYGENLIFGVDLKLLGYMGMKTAKIKDKIKLISSDFLDNDKILIEYKKNVEDLVYEVRFIPYLYSIRNGQNDTSSLIHIPRKG